MRPLPHWFQRPDVRADDKEFQRKRLRLVPIPGAMQRLALQSRVHHQAFVRAAHVQRSDRGTGEERDHHPGFHFLGAEERQAAAAPGFRVRDASTHGERQIGAKR